MFDNENNVTGPSENGTPPAETTPVAAPAPEVLTPAEAAPVAESLIPPKPMETPAAETFSIPQTPTATPGESRFSEAPNGGWTRPIEQTPPPYTPPATVRRAPTSWLDNAQNRLTALLLCLCLLLSGISGFVGVMVGKNSAAGIGAAGTSSSTLPSQNVVMWEAPTDMVVPVADDNTELLSAAIHKVFASVVEISTETVVSSGGIGGSAIQSGAGSGVILTADGYIATNNHVIEGASTIQVRLSDGTLHSAVLRGTDPQTDLAVLKIEATDLPAVTWTSTLPQLGQTVFAIGNPLGTLGGSVSDGIISAVGREITVDNMPMTLLQTNAAVNPGNSGGGLFDLAGNLIGIVNAKYASEELEGLGFAIPAEIAKAILAELVSQGYVTGRPQIGVQLVSVSNSNFMSVYSAYPELYSYIRQFGVGIYVQNATSAVMVSGELHVGDYLVSVDGTPISSFDDIQAILLTHAVGDELELVVRRAGQTEPFTVTVKLTQKTATAA